MGRRCNRIFCIRCRRAPFGLAGLRYAELGRYLDYNWVRCSTRDCQMVGRKEASEKQRVLIRHRDSTKSRYWRLCFAPQWPGLRQGLFQTDAFSLSPALGVFVPPVGIAAPGTRAVSSSLIIYENRCRRICRCVRFVGR